MVHCPKMLIVRFAVRANSGGIPVIPTLVVGECFNYRREDILLVAIREKKSQRKHVLTRSMKELLGISVYFNIYF